MRWQNRPKNACAAESQNKVPRRSTDGAPASRRKAIFLQIEVDDASSSRRARPSGSVVIEFTFYDPTLAPQAVKIKARHDGLKALLNEDGAPKWRHAVPGKQMFEQHAKCRPSAATV